MRGKIHLLGIMLVFLPLSSKSQSGWVKVYPLPTGNALRTVQFVDSLVGYVVGDGGVILKTKDGGESWEIQESGVTGKLWAVCFPQNAEVGYVGGGSGVLKTEDGGKYWTKLIGVDGYICALSFPENDQVGYALDEGARVIFKTEDGGKYWEKLNVYDGRVYSLCSLCFPKDDKVGYAGGDNGAIFKTVDGGSTWVEQQYDLLKGLVYSINFPLDDRVGYATVGNEIMKTSDGGENWLSIYKGGKREWLYSVCFPQDTLTGYAVGEDGIILKTEDGGKQWRRLHSGTIKTLNSIHFPQDVQTGYTVGGEAYASGESLRNSLTKRERATGEVGAIAIKTTDGGEHWKSLFNTMTKTLYSACFPENSEIGYTAGEDVILKTEDGGKTWKVQDTSMYIRSLCFPAGSDTGFGVGITHLEDLTIKAIIARTYDGGNHWIKDTVPYASELYSLSLSEDYKMGFLVGHHYIFKTTDKGRTWRRLMEGPYSSHETGKGLSFIPPDTVYVVGSREVWSNTEELVAILPNIYKTINASEYEPEWRVQDPGYFGDDTEFYSVCFPENSWVGYIGGHSGALDDGRRLPLILKTINCGGDWINLELPDFAYGTISSLCFIHNEVGYAVGIGWKYNGEKKGIILKTTDGGETWEEQNIGNVFPLYSVWFVNSDTGYAVGENGIILKTTTGGEGIEDTVSDKCSVVKLENHPNPFRESTVIRFQLPVKTVVSLKVYDISGRAVRILTKAQSLKPGIYTVEWNGRDDKGMKLSAGVYFYRLETKEYTSTKKLVWVR